MSAIKSKPIFEERFLAFKCTFPKDHITLECWRRAAGVLEDVTALTTTGRNHSGRDFTAPVFCLLSIQRIVPCASACVSYCAFSVLLCIGQRSQGVCAAQPQCCWKTFINDLLLLRKAQLYYFPGRNQIWAEETVWRRCHRLFPLQGEEVDRLQLLPFHSLLFALPSTVCSAFYISLLALLSTVSTSSTNKWTICPVSVFPIQTISPKSLAQQVNLKYQKSAIKLFRLKMTHHPTSHSLLTNFLKVIRLERGNWI